LQSPPPSAPPGERPAPPEAPLMIRPAKAPIADPGRAVQQMRAHLIGRAAALGFSVEAGVWRIEADSVVVVAGARTSGCAVPARQVATRWQRAVAA